MQCKVLDACCGSRMAWHDKSNPLAVFMDNRKIDETLCDGLATVVKRQSVGQLNPDWVEILQGLPIGWTDPECDNPAPWPGWPAPPDMGGQYAYEPPRTVTGMKGRAARLKALGNCNPPQMYGPFLKTIAAIDSVVTD